MIYSLLAFPSAHIHFTDPMDVLSDLYPKLNLNIGVFWTQWSDTEPFPLLREGMLQMRSSPLLYPTTTLLPKGHTQHAEDTCFVSLCSGCDTFPPVLTTDLLSRISHNIIRPFLKIMSTLHWTHKRIEVWNFSSSKSKSQINYIATSLWTRLL